MAFLFLFISVQFKDPGNNYQTVRRLKLNLRSMSDGPPAATLAKKLLNDVVANGINLGWDMDKMSLTSFGNYDLQVSGNYRHGILFLISS